MIKKIIYTITIILITTHLYAEEYYVSNILGMKLDRIVESQTGEHNYYLKISIEKGIEIEELYNKDELIFTKRSTSAVNLLTVVTEKKDSTEKQIYRDGLLFTEETINDNTTEKTVYTYKDRKLEQTQYYKDEQLVYTDYYLYTTSGRLLDVNRKYSNNLPSSRLSFLFKNGKISNYQLDSEKQSNYVVFNENGIKLNEVFYEGAIKEKRNYGFNPDGTKFEKIFYPDKNESLLLSYDSRERIILSKLTDSEDVIIEETSFEYQSGRIKTQKIKGYLFLKRYDYEYDNDGKLVKEVFSLNGVIDKITDYIDAENYVETIYIEGTKSLEIVYRNGVRFETRQAGND